MPSAFPATVLRIAVLAAPCVLAAVAQAQTLAIPGDAQALRAAVAAQCPDCLDEGLLPCGTAEVRYGDRFAATAMQGTPPRAYLLARAPVSAELTPLLGGSSPDKVAAALRQAFSTLRVIVVEADWRSARVLAPRYSPAVRLDPSQQACFRDPARSLGCCLGDGPADAGCLPKADPPDVRLEPADVETGEALRLRYPVGKGEIRLTRAPAEGAGQTLYWCHKWQRAKLEGSR